MYIYICFVLYFTLMPIITELPFIFNHPYHSMNMIPFVDVIGSRGDFIRQIVLNVVMMIPFGILYSMIRKDENKLFISTIFSCFLFSLIIELVQPLINGIHTSDITDLITNVFGVIIGYLIYIIFKPPIFKIINKII